MLTRSFPPQRKVYSQLRQIDTSLDRWRCCKVVASLLHINVDNREKEWLEQLEQVASEVDGVLSDVADAIERYCGTYARLWILERGRVRRRAPGGAGTT